MEIVSKADLRSPDEVSIYIKKLRSIMRYLGTCDGNMQEGSLRADVNVSVRKKGDKKLGTRCEIKNVNSIKFMQMAIDYEANEKMALHQFGLIFDAIEKRWSVESVRLAHRLGVVPAKETSLRVDIIAPHRAEAFEACQFLINEMKVKVPIWKRPQ